MIGRCWLGDIMSWLDVHNGAITALATVVIGWFTFALVRVSSRQAALISEQVIGARDSAERQLRAYLLVQGCALTHSQDGANWFASLEIKNFGQTPAHDVATWVGTIVSDFPLAIELPDPPQSLRKSKSIIAPTNHEVSIIPVERPTTDQWELIRAERGAIYVWGKVQYRDAFKETRHLQFRLKLSGDVGSRKGWFVNCENGNEAD